MEPAVVPAESIQTQSGLPVGLALRLLAWLGPRLLILLSWYWVVGAGVVSADARSLDFGNNRGFFQVGVWGFVPVCVAVCVLGARVLDLTEGKRHGVFRFTLVATFFLYWTFAGSVFIGAWGDRHPHRYPPLLRPDHFARAYVQALRSE